MIPMTRLLRQTSASFFTSLVLCFCVNFYSGCSTDETDESDPTALLKEAEENIEGSRFLLAIDQLKSLKNQHPYSDEAITASLRLADVYFLQENFLEASAQYEAFKDLHPKHASTEYAVFRTGLSRYKDAPEKLQRDLTSLSKAEQDFKEYLERYPTGSFRADAETNYKEAREKLAKKQMMIARWYRGQKMYEAARGRYQKVVSEYSDTASHAAAENEFKAIEGKVDP